MQLILILFGSCSRECFQAVSCMCVNLQIFLPHNAWMYKKVKGTVYARVVFITWSSFNFKDGTVLLWEVERDLCWELK
jgi:hypothetical protein